ncbi:MAG: nucleotidyl transferase AbiEii/AbiGii toxin family protein [Halobacteriota archaeon]
MKADELKRLSGKKNVPLGIIYKFSMDLDFTCLEDVSREIFSELKNEFENKNVRSIEFRGIKEEERRNDSFRHSVRYKDISKHPNSVKLDLSLRKEPVEHSEKREVLNSYYENIPIFEVRTMAPEEVLAEKVRAVITRGAPRDVYDIRYLLVKGVEFKPDLVNKKLEILTRDNEFKWDLFDEKLKEKQNEWERDLGLYYQRFLISIM